MNNTLGIIGCGKMAYAILKGISQSDISTYENIYICDIDNKKQDEFAKEFNAEITAVDDIPKVAKVILLAVKPTQIEEVVSKITNHVNEQHIIVSVAAGIRTEQIQKHLNYNVPVVRVMPNTPSLVMEGIAAISTGMFADETHIEIIKQVFDSIGISIIIDEKYMDAITAVSGSGPAYVYLVIESMIDAAINIGLDSNTAKELVISTFKGSIKMIEDTNLHPAVLKQQVMSPGGTTVAGVRQLEENGIRTAFFNGVEKAYKRSIELGKLS